MSKGGRNTLLTIVVTSGFWLALIAAYLLFAQRRPAAQPIEILPPPTVTPAPIALETPTPAPLRVYVSGAVLSPGVYRLPPESLVADAIEIAGGGTDGADLVAINLAHPLADGEQIHVPLVGETPPTPLPSRSSGTELSVVNTAPIDLNNATPEELDTLPGVGPKTAEAIIQGRPYSSVEDLLRVKGIGEATLEKLRGLVTVE
ncbi:MAG: ComEA family DNA-binding protein [Caldilineales bacterium]|nr:ComEA family DNA-binding protein [Caldilineales bacterium]